MGTSKLLLPEASLEDLKQVRQFVQEKLVEQAIEADAQYDLLLAVTEAVTNTIVHGYGGQPGWMQLEIKLAEGSILIIVQDQAPPFDPTQVPVPDITQPLERRLMGGMGVYLIRQNVDQLFYRRGSGDVNELTMVRRVNSQKQTGG